MVKLSVEEFLCGHWLKSQGKFRGQLLGQVVLLPYRDDVIEDWPAVLSACCHESACEEAVLLAVTQGAALQWAEGCIQDRSLPLNFRLRLAAAVGALRGVVPEAEAALLRGAPVAPEAVQWLSAPKLWPQLIARGLVVPAVALLEAHPLDCTDSDEVTSVIAKSLQTGPGAEAKAALVILSSLRGGDSASLLTALLQRQPLHLLETLPLPQEDFHLTAALLALRHSDRRVAARLLPQLGQVLLQEVVEAAAKAEPWTVPWWPAAGREALTGAVEQLCSLMRARPWTSVTLLDDLVSTWLEAFGKARPVHPPAAETLGCLKLDLPKHAQSLAKSLMLTFQAAEMDSELLLEIACCGVQVPDLGSLAATAPRGKLRELAGHGASAGLARDASTALWALKNVADATLERVDGGFQLQLREQRCGFIAWEAARKAVLGEPALAAAYPRQDPQYASFRHELLKLGAFAASHAGDELLPLAQAALKSAEKLAFLEAARAVYQVSARMQLKKIALEWAKGDDRMVVTAAVSTLVELGGGSEDFLQLWPGLKKMKGALAPAALLLHDASRQVLETVLTSSSLCSSLARQLLRQGHVQHLAVLGVRAAGRDARPLAEDHPAVQLCTAELPEEQKRRVVQGLLEMQSSLPVEGSPHGEAHGQHLRFWLCLGSLMCAEDAPLAAKAAMEALRGPLLPATRVLVQNVWAKAASESQEQVSQLVQILQNVELPEAFAANCLAVAAQLLLHPGKGQPVRGRNQASVVSTGDLWKSMVAWSASYVHGPRLLASLALFHALEQPGLLTTPGWYLEALHRQVRDASVFKKLRARVKMDDWISASWSMVKPSRPLDVLLANASKQVAGDFWSPQGLEQETEEQKNCGGGLQRRPERQPQGLEEIDVVVCASLVDNVPNMAGLVRTSEALLGGRVEVALRNDKVLQEASFQKMVVAADKSVRMSSVPCGPRLLAFLREHRCAGREVIALEQTSSSEMLQVELRLPKKFVLLLGSEQEGLPAWLLQSGLVDRCIELPLQGKTGSLNVHVAAAMLLWHYRLHN